MILAIPVKYSVSGSFFSWLSTKYRIVVIHAISTVGKIIEKSLLREKIFARSFFLRIKKNFSCLKF